MNIYLNISLPDSNNIETKTLFPDSYLRHKYFIIIYIFLDKSMEDLFHSSLLFLEGLNLKLFLLIEITLVWKLSIRKIWITKAQD